MTIQRKASDFGKFSEVVSVQGPGSWIHVSGQVAFDQTGKAVIGGGIAEQAEVIFDQMEQHLAAVGASLADIVKLNIFLVDLAEYAEFSAVRARRFPDNPPASAAVGVASLLLGAKLEIDAVAFRADPV